MEPYRNLAGDSGIESYEIGADYVRVQFRGGRTYRYEHAIFGEIHVRRLKALAAAGSGLGTYISKYLRTGAIREDS